MEMMERMLEVMREAGVAGVKSMGVCMGVKAGVSCAIAGVTYKPPTHYSRHPCAPSHPPKPSRGSTMVAALLQRDHVSFGVSAGAAACVYNLVSPLARPLLGPAGGAVAAGLVSGALFGWREDGERGVELALYLLTRGVDVVVRRWSGKWGLKVPRVVGVVGVFMLLQSIIMWAYAYAPHALPKRYLKFMAGMAARQKRMVAHIRRVMRTRASIRKGESLVDVPFAAEDL